MNHTFIWASVLMGVVATTTPRPAASQQFEFNEFHTWTDVATIYKFSDTFRYDGDYGIRGFLTDDDWTLIYLRPSVRYQSRPWLRLHGGVALFYNFFKTVEDVPELRPWVGVRFVGPSPGGWVISNYLRLEGRAFYLKDEDKWDTVLRGRWQVQVTTPDFAIRTSERFYALASIEPFTGFGASINGILGERIRTNIGMGKRVTPALRIDLNYVFHRIRVSETGRDFDLDDHVVRLRFFYTFKG
ncbi:MAG: DUF2490 domain-containing protein [Candidatus Krumholzibacteriota bacterium]|nr:DUF2490 domain-containing protein [Candidatus Krumholzibacteriota bacterium]